MPLGDWLTFDLDQESPRRQPMVRRTPGYEQNLGGRVRAGCVGKCPDIAHRDAPRIKPLDDSGRFQVLQLAADGFQAETQIVCHFRACEREDELAAWPLFAIET